MLHIIDVLDERYTAEESNERLSKDLESIIDAYFHHKYRKDCNYQFWHFATDKVWGNVALQLEILDSTEYFEHDGSVRDSMGF
jgi:hypothetical protein